MVVTAFCAWLCVTVILIGLGTFPTWEDGSTKYVVLSISPARQLLWPGAGHVKIRPSYPGNWSRYYGFCWCFLKCLCFFFCSGGSLAILNWLPCNAFTIAGFNVFKRRTALLQNLFCHCPGCCAVCKHLCQVSTARSVLVCSMCVWNDICQHIGACEWEKQLFGQTVIQRSEKCLNPW